MNDEAHGPGPLIAHLEEIAAVPCPCGQARRAFLDPANRVASIHLVDIGKDPETHYHNHHTEIYYILDGEGLLELDGRQHPIRAGSGVLIPPGVRHRTIGKIRLLNIPIPPFDPQDELFD